MRSQQPAVDAASSGSADALPGGQTIQKQPKMEHNSYLSDDDTDAGTWSDGLRAIEEFDWASTSDNEESRASATTELQLDGDSSTLSLAQQKDLVPYTDGQQCDTASLGPRVEYSSPLHGLDPDMSSRKSSPSLLVPPLQSPTHISETTTSPMDGAIQLPTMISSGNDSVTGVYCQTAKTDLYNTDVSETKDIYEGSSSSTDTTSAFYTPTEHLSPFKAVVTCSERPGLFDPVGGSYNFATDDASLSLTVDVSTPGGSATREPALESGIWPTHSTSPLEEDMITDTVLQRSGGAIFPIDEATISHPATSEVYDPDCEAISIYSNGNDTFPLKEPDVAPSQAVSPMSVVDPQQSKDHDLQNMDRPEDVLKGEDGGTEGNVYTCIPSEQPLDPVASISNGGKHNILDATTSNYAIRATEEVEGQQLPHESRMNGLDTQLIPPTEEISSRSDFTKPANEGLFTKPYESPSPILLERDAESAKTNLYNQASVADGSKYPAEIPINIHSSADPLLLIDADTPVVEPQDPSESIHLSRNDLLLGDATDSESARKLREPSLSDGEKTNETMAAGPLPSSSAAHSAEKIANGFEVHDGPSFQVVERSAIRDGFQEVAMEPEVHAGAAEIVNVVHNDTTKEAESAMMMPPPTKNPTDRIDPDTHMEEGMSSQMSSELSDPPSTAISQGSSRRSSLKAVETIMEDEEEAMERRMRSDAPEPSPRRKRNIPESEATTAGSEPPTEAISEPKFAKPEERETESRIPQTVQRDLDADKEDHAESKSSIVTPGLEATEPKTAPKILSSVEQSTTALPIPISPPSIPAPVSKSKLKAVVKNSGKRKRPAAKKSKDNAAANKAFKPGADSDSGSSADEKSAKKKKASRASTPRVNLDKATPRKKDGKFTRTPKSKQKAGRVSTDGATDVEKSEMESQDFDISSDKEEEVESPFGGKGQNEEPGVDDTAPDTTSSSQEDDGELDVDQENRPPTSAPAPIPSRLTRRTSVAAAKAVKSPKESPAPPKPELPKRTTRAASVAVAQSETSYVRSLTPTDLNPRYEKRTTRSDTKPQDSHVRPAESTLTAANAAKSKVRAKLKANGRGSKTQTLAPEPKKVIPEKRKGRRSSARLTNLVAVTNEDTGHDDTGTEETRMNNLQPEEPRGRRASTRLRDIATAAATNVATNVATNAATNAATNGDIAAAAESEKDNESEDEAEDEGEQDEDESTNAAPKKARMEKRKEKGGTISKPPHKIRTRRMSLAEERDTNIGKRLRSGDKVRNSLG
ncbi:hypothetical protein K491DRAFT_476164 [Lophiostoma macrostomum CBS 122681]|uniref:Uncharacterized protein n=1 Tax=Lophiostoma macrostomum CBS 122681 TaxID=1314788 RepID=A0A6A6T340_9PLEO|nr:hypothetical protein K491DRAFT_476164 [Lophiostoma macrostomum CBS 122681]